MFYQLMCVAGSWVGRGGDGDGLQRWLHVGNGSVFMALTSLPTSVPGVEDVTVRIRASVFPGHAPRLNPSTLSSLARPVTSPRRASWC